MFSYNKFLEFPINIKHKNPRLANIVATQYGGPNGELGASLRYLSQRYTMPNEMTKGLLTDIGMSCAYCSRLFGSNAEFNTTFHLCGSKFK